MRMPAIFVKTVVFNSVEYAKTLYKTCGHVIILIHCWGMNMDTCPAECNWVNTSAVPMHVIHSHASFMIWLRCLMTLFFMGLCSFVLNFDCLNIIWWTFWQWPRMVQVEWWWVGEGLRGGQRGNFFYHEVNSVSHPNQYKNKVALFIAHHSSFRTRNPSHT